MQLANNIQHLRKSKGMTRVELAQKLGVCKSNIWKYEHDQLLPPLDIVLRLSEIFEVTLDTLVTANISQLPIYTIEEVKSAAKIIKNYCNSRNSNPETDCIECPIRDICDSDPYLWEV